MMKEKGAGENSQARSEPLLVGININYLAGRIGKSFKVKFRNDEILLLGGEAKLGSDDRIEQHRELISVVNGFQQYLDGRGKAHQLVGDIELRAGGSCAEGVRDKNGCAGIRGGKGVNAGGTIDAVLSQGWRRRHARQRNAGAYIAYTPILLELRRIGNSDGEWRGWNGGRFVKGGFDHASSQGLAEEKVIEHFAINGSKLGFACDLAFSARHGLRKLLLTVKLFYVARNIQGYVLKSSKFHGSGVGSGVSAHGKAPQST